MSDSAANLIRTHLYRLILLSILSIFTVPALHLTASEPDLSDSLDPDISLTEADIRGEKVRVFLIARDEATISSEIDGRIIALPYVMGDTFNKGDTLVEIDSELALAARDKAEKELEASRINLEAIQDLKSRGDATLVELINAEKDLAVSEAGLILARKNLSMCRITAPFSGRVIKVEKNTHELAKAGEPLISIIDDSTLLAHFLLPISAFPDTEISAEIEINIPILSQIFTGRISQISATLDAASGTFEVAADIDNSQNKLRAGMSGWFTPDRDE